MQSNLMSVRRKTVRFEDRIPVVKKICVEDFMKNHLELNQVMTNRVLNAYDRIQYGISRDQPEQYSDSESESEEEGSDSEEENDTNDNNTNDTNDNNNDNTNDDNNTNDVESDDDSTS